MGKYYNSEDVKRRREEIAYLSIVEEYTIEELVELSGYSDRTIRRDLKYIESHKEEFLI